MTVRIHKNDAYKELEKKFAVIYSKSCPENQNLFTNLRAVFFELSNICNYSKQHRKCPAHHVKKRKVLSSSIYIRTINELSEIQFSGVISFHRYNEPMMDPRLSSFLAYAKQKLPDPYLRVYTNGYYLTQEIVDDLSKAGMNWLEVSAYSNKEYERFLQLNVSIPYMVFESKLDDRIILYDKNEKNLRLPCFSIINDCTINCEGKLVLCCLDWKNNHCLADLNKTSLKAALNTDKIRKIFFDLTEGSRTLHLCKRCVWQR
jgi:hypothetical protein